MPDARRSARTHLLLRGVPEDLCENAVLLVSELVSNAVLRAEGPVITCQARIEADRIRVEVRDQGKGACDSALRSRGLFLVDRLADAWGIIPEHGAGAGGRTVWAELPLTPGSLEESGVRT